MQLRLLGPSELWANGREISLGGPKQRALLALLGLRADEAVRRERIIEVLWGEDPPEGVAHRLDAQVSRLRSAIRNAGGDASLVETVDGGYRMRLNGTELDLLEAERLIEQGRSALADGRAPEAVDRLRAALRLWRGPALADLVDDAASQGEIRRLEELRLAALEDRLEGELTLGRHTDLVPELRRLVAEHPLRERLRALLMLALHRGGRVGEALEVYRDARRAFIEELGIEPSEALRDLERGMLAQDRVLGGPSDPIAAPLQEPAPAPEPARADPAARRRPTLVAGGIALAAAAVVAVVVVLVASGGDDNAPPLADDSQAVVLIDPAKNEVTEVVSVGARPASLAYDRDSGSLWVANLDDRSVTHIVADGLRVGRTIAVDDVPTGLAAGGGVLWVASGNRTDAFVTLRKISARFDALERTVRVPSSPYGGADVALDRGALWVAPSFGLLRRLDSQTGALRRPAVDTGHAPTALAVGDAVWVADESANTVTRVDPTSGLGTPVPVGNGPAGVAVAQDGVWVTLAGDDSVVRIDPETAAVRQTIPVGRRPAGVAVGGGSVWVANSGDGTVSRIDSGGDRVMDTVRVGASPQDVAVADGKVWVSVRPRTVSDLAQPGGAVLVESQGGLDSIDPALAFSQSSFQLEYATAAKLLNYPDEPGPAGSRLVPEVAQSIPRPSADGRTYTFRIREGFRFSPPSGEPVTAQTFKYTIERSLSPKLEGPAAAYLQGLLSDVVGAQAYSSGRARRVAGLTARGDTLTIKLTQPSADFLHRIALPFFAAVPPDTPVAHDGAHPLPSAGPYYIASYEPDEGAVLKRNPNYGGGRPHSLREIRLRLGVAPRDAIAHVEASSADYAVDAVGPQNAEALGRRYGPGSPAARRGKQQYFVNRSQAVDYLELNTSRAPFSSARMRRAVNYAIDRRALARAGGINNALPAIPTDQYLPAGIPGFRDGRLYPLTPDVARARSLAGGRRQSVVLYAFDRPPSPQLAEIVKTNLKAIGLDVHVRLFADPVMIEKAGTPGEPVDIVLVPWIPDYPDPASVMTIVDPEAIEGNPPVNFARFDDPAFGRRLAAAAKLSGPSRYIAYGRLDLDLTRGPAPMAAFGNESAHDFFSARIGCQVYNPIYGMDLAALCIRR